MPSSTFRQIVGGSFFFPNSLDSKFVTPFLPKLGHHVWFMVHMGKFHPNHLLMMVALIFH
jgi:hypothetical protein